MTSLFSKHLLPEEHNCNRLEKFKTEQSNKFRKDMMKIHNEYDYDEDNLFFKKRKKTYSKKKKKINSQKKKKKSKKLNILKKLMKIFK